VLAIAFFLYDERGRQLDGLTSVFLPALNLTNNPSAHADNVVASRNSFAQGPESVGVGVIREGILGGDPNAAIRYTYEHLVCLVLTRSDHHFARPISDRSHGFSAIHHQVDNYLLELDGITVDLLCTENLNPDVVMVKPAEDPV
jgi:hypothetical protein